jgi:hypothetical protein
MEPLCGQYEVTGSRCRNYMKLMAPQHRSHPEKLVVHFSIGCHPCRQAQTFQVAFANM